MTTENLIILCLIETKNNVDQAVRLFKSKRGVGVTTAYVRHIAEDRTLDSRCTFRPVLHGYGLPNDLKPASQRSGQ